MSDSKAFHPRVTACIVTCNRPQLFREALATLLAQTYDNLHMMVVNDGEEHGLGEFLRETAPQVHYLHHETNRGLGAARNTAIEHAEGAWLALLDDDDKWEPEFVADHIAALSVTNRTQLALCVCGQRLFFPGTNREPREFTPAPIDQLRDAYLEGKMLNRSSNGVFSVEALRSVEGYDSRLRTGMDHDILFSLIRKQYRGIAIPQVLVHTISHQGRNSIMANTDKRIDGMKAFMEKWAPFFEELYPGKGPRQAARYNTHVMAGLINLKAKERDWPAVGKAFQAARCYPNSGLHAWYVGLREIAKGFISGVLRS